MAKEFNAENAARQMIADGAVMGKVSKLNLLSVLRVLSNWVRSANLRAKAAEETLREMPNWRSQCSDLQRVNQSLQRRLESAQANEHALEERARQYAEMNDKMVDAHTKQVAELDALIVHLKALAEAAIERGNGLVELAHIQHRVATADIALVSLGATCIPYQASST